jgi:hypothetical protein
MQERGSKLNNYKDFEELDQQASKADRVDHGIRPFCVIPEDGGCYKYTRRSPLCSVFRTE